MCVVAAELDRLKVCSIRAGGVVVCCGGFDRKWDGDRGSTEVVLYMSRCGRMLAVYMCICGDVASIASLCIEADDVDDGEGIDLSLRNPKNPNLEHTPTQPAPTANCRGIKSYRRPSLFRCRNPNAPRLSCLCLPGPGVAFADDVPLMGRRSPQKAVSPRQQAPRFKHDLRRRRRCRGS